MTAASRLFLIAAVIALSPWGSITAAETGFTLTNLMESLREVKSASARFTERKYLHMLTQTVESSGTLSYRAPDAMEKITLSPASESILLEGNLLTGKRPNNETYKLNLADHPEVAGLVEGIRSTLAGDLPVLLRYYAVEAKGTQDAWELILTPSDAAVRRMVAGIRIAGSKHELRRIEVTETDGDRSEMTVTYQAP